MHEIGAVNAAAAHFLRTVAGRRVRQVTLALGPGVDGDVADSTWRTAVDASPAAGAELILTRLDDLLSCFSCGAEYRGTKLHRCPVCGGNGIVVDPAPEVSVVDWLGAEPDSDG